MPFEPTPLDWSGNAKIETLWRATVQERPLIGDHGGGNAAHWAGAAASREDAHWSALSFTRRAHAIFATVAEPLHSADHLCGVVSDVYRESEDEPFEVGIGRAMGSAFGNANALPKAKAPFDPAELAAACEAGLRLHARRARLPERSCAITMSYGAWQMEDASQRLSSSLSDLVISDDDVYQDLPKTERLAFLQEALAIASLLSSDPRHSDAQGGGIDIPGSATLRAALRSALEDAAAQDLATVRAFLEKVGLAHEARAWEALA